MRRDEKKMARAERLFDAIGMIDDRIIAETQEPYVKQIKRYPSKKIIPILAIILVFTIMAVGMFSIALHVFRVNEDFINSADDDKSNFDNFNGEVSTSLTNSFEQLLHDAEERDDILKHKAEQFDFFDGKIYLTFDRERTGAKEIRLLVFTEDDIISPDTTLHSVIISKP